MQGLKSDLESHPSWSWARWEGQFWGFLRPLRLSTNAAQIAERTSWMGPKYEEEETCKTDGCIMTLPVTIIVLSEEK